MMSHMRIIFLNTWNGKIKEGIINFITEQSAATDVFCLQEVYDFSRPMFESLLPGFQGIHVYRSAGRNDNFSQVTYVKKNLVMRSSETLLYRYS